MGVQIWGQFQWFSDGHGQIRLLCPLKLILLFPFSSCFPTPPSYCPQAVSSTLFSFFHLSLLSETRPPTRCLISEVLWETRRFLHPRTRCLENKVALSVILVQLGVSKGGRIETSTCYCLRIACTQHTDYHCWEISDFGKQNESGCHILVSDWSRAETIMWDRKSVV